MVHSTWGDWLVSEEVEASSPDGLSVWYLGCHGFVLRSPEATVYIDPYFADGDPPHIVRMIPVPMDPADASMCDAVLASHEHIDHFHPPSYGPLLTDLDATLYAPQASFDHPDYEGDLSAPEDQRSVISVGDTFEIEDLTVHVCESNDPDAIEPVTYVIEHESGTFLHAGDSRPTDAFREIGERFDITVGALAFGTVGNVYYPDDDEVRVAEDWYCDENQIIEAARALQLDRLLPAHSDMWRSVTADPKSLHDNAASFAYPKVVEPVTIGDRLDLDSPGIVPSQVLQK